MFDVGFWELCMVGLISLLVIGPERLPKAARIAGFWIGKSQRMVSAVKQEIKQELREEELRQLMQEQNVVDDLKQLDQELKSAADTLTTNAQPGKAKVTSKANNDGT